MLKKFTVTIKNEMGKVIEIKTFDELPRNTYFFEGYQNEADTGKAVLHFDNALIPIIVTKTGKQYCDASRAGQSI